MIFVKVITGGGRRQHDERISSASEELVSELIGEGWHQVGRELDSLGLHPSEVCEEIDDMIRSCKEKGYERVFLCSNCDHVFNRLRVLRYSNDVDGVEFIHIGLNPSDGRTVVRYRIKVTDEGECSWYPSGFMDEGSRQIGELSAVCKGERERERES